MGQAALQKFGTLGGLALSAMGMPEVGIPLSMGSGLLFGGGGGKSAAPSFAPPPQLAQAPPTQPLNLGVPQMPQQASTMPPATQAALQPPQNRLPSGANQMSPDDQLTAFLAARGIQT